MPNSKGGWLVARDRARVVPIPRSRRLQRVDYVWREAEAVGVWIMYFQDGGSIRLMPDGSFEEEHYVDKATTRNCP